MKALQEKGYTEKDLLNSKCEAQNLADLEFLKAQELPGPFTSGKDVMEFMSYAVDQKTRNTRLHREVRYARMTSLSLKETASVFHFKKIREKPRLRYMLISWCNQMTPGVLGLSQCCIA